MFMVSDFPGKFGQQKQKERGKEDGHSNTNKIKNGSQPIGQTS